MKIRIAIGSYCSQNKELDKYLKANAGKFVKVETDYLFNDQYNTAKFRLFDSHISEVKDDARVNMGKCAYCGKMHTKDPKRPRQKCYEHKECKQYEIKWFTPDNTLFLRYPKGCIQNKPVQPQMIGSYHLENTLSGYYWLHNARKSIKFSYNEQETRRFIIHDSIGSKQSRFLDIPMTALSKLINVLDKTNRK